MLVSGALRSIIENLNNHWQVTRSAHPGPDPGPNSPIALSQLQRFEHARNSRHIASNPQTGITGRFASAP